MKWEVELTGDRADLALLKNSFNDSSLSISEKSDEYILLSEQFGILKNARDVRKKAEEIVTALSGAAHLLLGVRKPVEVGAIYSNRQDGKRDTFISPQPVVLQFRGELSFLVKRADGTIETHHPTDLAPGWVKLALQDEIVARALRLRNVNSLEWVDLYRLFEVIESDISAKNMEAKGWIIVGEIKRFKRTANSQKTIGDKARHGKDLYEPPKKPMHLLEAKELIDNIMKAWLLEKEGQAYIQPTTFLAKEATS